MTSAQAPGTLQINCGGGAYTSAATGNWVADTDFIGGNTYNFGGTVSGTKDPTLFQAIRFDPKGFSYSLPATPGAYTLNLYFEEGDKTGPGQRVFSVSVNGSVVLPSLDVWQAAGGNNIALIKTIPVTVPAGASSITVSFQTVTTNCMVSALQLVPTGPPTPPAAPTGLTATAGVGQVGLTWAAVTGATSYNLYRGTSSGGENPAAITQTTGTSYIDTGLTKGAPYFYVVRAVNGNGTSPPSNETSATLNGGLPTPLYRFDSAGTNQHFLTASQAEYAALASSSYWISRGVIGYVYLGANDAPGLIPLYRLYYPSTGDHLFTDSAGERATILASGRWNDEGVACYVLGGAGATLIPIYRAYDAATSTHLFTGDVNEYTGLSFAWSKEGIQFYVLTNKLPATPTGLTATAGSTQISLTWATVTGAATYNLYRATTVGGEGTTPYKSGLTTAAYTDTGLTPGTTVYYKVTAINGVGEGAPSSEVSATLTTPPPSAPVGLAATAGSAQVGLAWSAVANAAGYNLYRATTAGGEGTNPYKTGLTTPDYTDTGLTNGVTYYYKVTALNTGGEGVPSAEVSSTPTAPNAPGTLQINCGGGAYTSAATGNWLADTDFIGGNTYNFGGTVSGTNDPTLFEYIRTDPKGFSYNLPATPGFYTLSLYFEEGDKTGPGQRVFSVSVNGTLVLNNLDVFTAAGGQSKGLIENIPVYTNGSGLTVFFQTVTTNCMVSAIRLTPAAASAPPSPPSGSLASVIPGQVALSWAGVPGTSFYNVYRSNRHGSGYAKITPAPISATSATDTAVINGTTYYYVVSAVNSAGESGYSSEVAATPVVPTGMVTYQINCGGTAYTSATAGLWQADNFFNGGTAVIFPSNAILGTSDPFLYQDARVSNPSFSYTLPVGQGMYTLRLSFDEGSMTGPGQRMFNVAVNGSPLLNDLDVFASAAGRNKAFNKSLRIMAGSGVTITFQTIINSSMISAIQLTPGGAVPTPGAMGPIRIMPLGDSITAYGTSYRRPLWEIMQNAGANVDYVGSQVTAPVGGLDYPGDCEGYPGFRTDQVLALIGSSSFTYMPDIVLIHLGTNDVRQGIPIGTAINNLSRIIDQLRADNPNVKVLLAQITPMADPFANQGVQALNAQIPALVAQKNTAQSPVILVNQYDGYNAATDTSDGIHPNASGAQKMANQWFAVLKALL